MQQPIFSEQNVCSIRVAFYVTNPNLTGPVSTAGAVHSMVREVNSILGVSVLT